MTKLAPMRWDMEEAYGDIADWPEKFMWGPAITHIERQDGQWWAHNEEYSTIIKYCPFCGVELERIEEALLQALENPTVDLRRWSDALQRQIDIPASVLMLIASLAYEVEATVPTEARTPELDAWLYRVKEVVVEIAGEASWDKAARMMSLSDRGRRQLAAWLERSTVPADLRERLKKALEDKGT